MHEAETVGMSAEEWAAANVSAIIEKLNRTIGGESSKANALVSDGLDIPARS